MKKPHINRIMQGLNCVLRFAACGVRLSLDVIIYNSCLLVKDGMNSIPTTLVVPTELGFRALFKCCGDGQYYSNGFNPLKFLHIYICQNMLHDFGFPPAANRKPQTAKRTKYISRPT